MIRLGINFYRDPLGSQLSTWSNPRRPCPSLHGCGQGTWRTEDHPSGSFRRAAGCFPPSRAPSRPARAAKTRVRSRHSTANFNEPPGSPVTSGSPAASNPQPASLPYWISTHAEGRQPCSAGLAIHVHAAPFGQEVCIVATIIQEGHRAPNRLWSRRLPCADGGFLRCSRIE